MCLYYKAVCIDEGHAIHAFRTTCQALDSVDGLQSYARKRVGSAILLRIDLPAGSAPPVIDLLMGTQAFIEIVEISERQFWEPRSGAV